MPDSIALQSAEVEQRTRLQRYARFALSLALLGLGLWTLHGFLAALVWAAVIAVAIGPLYIRAVKRWPPGKHNILMPLLFTTVVAIVFLLPFIVLGVQAAREAQSVEHFVSGALQSGIPEPEWVNGLPFGAAQVSSWWKANLTSASDVSELLRHAVRHAQTMQNRGEIVTAFTHRIVIFFFTIVTLFFVLRSSETLTAEMLRASYKLFGPHGEVVARQIVSSIHGTVDGLVLVGLVEGLLLGIVYVMAGVPHPTLLGALSAVAAMIPFLLVALVVVVGLVLMAQGAIGAAIAVVVIGWLMVFVSDHFVRPILIGGATKLPFIWVLLGILGGVETWGLVGLFVGPAIMAALILLWRELVKPQQTLVGVSARGTTLSPIPIAGE